MWMMGYNDAGEFNTIQDPFAGTKLRPLMPRPVDHFLRLNHHLAMVEQTKRELTSTQQVVVSSRWNPTAEQLQTLEELYRRGTQSPTADQIQQITAQLRQYGKVEGKNVFYWFQNHKARERHKRRRHLESLSDDQQQPINNNNNNNNNQTEKEENREPLVSNRAAFEVEQTKNRAFPTNSSTIAEKTAQGATKGADDEAAADGCVQFNDDDILLQQRRDATWQMMMHLSCSPSSSSSSYNTNPTNPSSLISTIHEQQPHDNDHFIDIFDSEPYIVNHHDSAGEAQTLQLFPLQSGRGLNDEGCGLMSDDHVMTYTPYQFFEFLPMKN